MDSTLIPTKGVPHTGAEQVRADQILSTCSRCPTSTSSTGNRYDHQDGLLFIDADQVGQDHREAISAPPRRRPGQRLARAGRAAAYRVDALADAGQSLHDRLGRGVRPPALDREQDQTARPGQPLVRGTDAPLLQRAGGT